MFVKPVAGARVLDPVHFRPLPDEGGHVPNNGYWRRHIARGDALDVDPPREEPASPSKGQE